MPEYLVTWRIDIEADTAEEAALAAVAIQRKPGSTAVVFEVKDKRTGATAKIDLEPDDDCDLCNDRGWDIVDIDPARGALGEILRCGGCRLFRDDLAAHAAARSSGFIVDDDGMILAYPSGFDYETFYQGLSPDPPTAITTETARSPTPARSTAGPRTTP